MAKSCNPNLPKADNPDYVCNPKTGRWIKKSKTLRSRRDHKTCKDTILSKYGIRIFPKHIYTRAELMDFKVSENMITHEYVSPIPDCFFLADWIPKKNLTVSNPLWKNITSYDELVRVTTKFFELLPPPYPTTKALSPRQEMKNYNQIFQIERIITSFLKTWQRLKQTQTHVGPSGLNSSELRDFFHQLKIRGVFPTKSLTHNFNSTVAIPPDRLHDIIQLLFGDKVRTHGSETQIQRSIHQYLKE